jgi:molybdopterin-binding protein
MARAFGRLARLRTD